MTVDELLVLALLAIADHESRRPCYVDHDALRTARAIIELLGGSDNLPGWPIPVVKGPRSVWWESLGMLLSSDECRAIAVMLLRAADAAEAGK